MGHNRMAEVRNEQMQPVHYSKRPSHIISPAHCFFTGLHFKAPTTLHLISHLLRAAHIYKWEPKVREQIAAMDTQKNTRQNSGKDALVQECLSTLLGPHPNLSGFRKIKRSRTNLLHEVAEINIKNETFQ